MTDAQIFNKLFSGGNFTLPYLIKFTHSSAGKICLINDNQSINYNNEVYKVCTFDYTKPDSKGSNASLNITSFDNDVYEFIENADHNYKLEVIGLLVDAANVQPIGFYKHFHGTVSMTESGTIEFQLGSDDRKDMVFTPYTYDTDSNPGNA